MKDAEQHRSEMPPQPAGGLIQLAAGVQAPESALRFQYARSRGPGGQNVNKVNTKAELWIEIEALIGPSDAALGRLRKMAGKRLTRQQEIHIGCDTERTQEANRQGALDRLRMLLENAMREPKPRRKVKPSKAARQRRLESKRRRGEIKSLRQGGVRSE